MSRTLIPKIICLLLVIGSFAWRPWPEAGYASLGFILLTALFLAAPVFRIASNFYVRTYVRSDSRDRIALTFDDGPDERFTPAVLDILRAEGVKATFFTVGDRLARHPDLARQIVEEGHVIGCHSLSHGLDYHFRSVRAYLADFAAFDAVTQAILHKTCKLFRSPQGLRTPHLGTAVRAAGKHCINWSARGYDAVERDADKIWQKLEPGIKAGGIVLMHDGSGLAGSSDRSATLETLPRVIREGRARGLNFTTVDALLGLDPYR